MNTEQKRQWLMALYPKSESWAAKVKKMPEAQVVAIYLSKQSQQNQPKERAS